MAKKAKFKKGQVVSRKNGLYCRIKKMEWFMSGWWYRFYGNFSDVSERWLRPLTKKERGQ